MESHLDKHINQRRIVMTNRFTFEVLKDKDDTILRDGETLTHKLMLRDSANLTPLQIADAATKDAMARDAAVFAASRRPGFVYTTVLDSQAGARAAARQASLDAYDRDISTAWQRKDTVIADAAVDPRQAWHDARANRTADTTDKHAVLIDAEYAKLDDELQNAWRKPAQF
jgi:hypothetical protein